MLLIVISLYAIMLLQVCNIYWDFLAAKENISKITLLKYILLNISLVFCLILLIIYAKIIKINEIDDLRNEIKLLRNEVIESNGN
jgi:hypothetical protein